VSRSHKDNPKHQVKTFLKTIVVYFLDMAKIYPITYFDNQLAPLEKANLSIASSAILYGLSVYTVFPVHAQKSKALAFRLDDHFKRLINSARIIGIDTFEASWTKQKFTRAVKDTVEANKINTDVFVRATVHVSELVPGTRSRGMKTLLSIFIYEATPILPLNGARLKTSVWRRIPDYAIPSRAKVNGAYVNSVLAKQDAIDSGYDDCIFLDASGHVCELSAGNIFMVRNNVLITPSSSNDILEGINRSTILLLAKDMGLELQEREVDLTELYIADEVFACGTSTYIAPIANIDNRQINGGKIGPITQSLKIKYLNVLHGQDHIYGHFVTDLKI